MDWEEIELELASIAQRLGIEVRHIRYEGEGGLCVIRGKRVLVINDWLDSPDRAAVMARGLATLPEVDQMYVVPEVRRLFEKYASEGHDS